MSVSGCPLINRLKLNTEDWATLGWTKTRSVFSDWLWSITPARSGHCHAARRRPSARSDNLVGPESAASRV